MQQQASLWKPALTSGFIFGFLSGIPLVGLLNCACCALIVGAGAVTSYLLVKASPVAVTYGQAALGGLVAGLFAVPVTFLTQTLFSIILDNDIRAQIQEAIDQAVQIGGADDTADIAAALTVDLVLAITVVCATVFFVAFGALGGVIGRSIFEKRSSTPEAPPVSGGMGEHGGAMPPPPPPPGSAPSSA